MAQLISKAFLWTQHPVGPGFHSPSPQSRKTRWGFLPPLTSCPFYLSFILQPNTLPGLAALPALDPLPAQIPPGES